MKKQENVLVEVYYQEHFKDIIIIDNEKNILLNSIKVYTLKENCIDKEVNFNICVSGNKMVLHPLEKSDEYVLLCQRVINATIIKIKATEYFNKVEKDGSFTFYMENKKV